MEMVHDEFEAWIRQRKVESTNKAEVDELCKGELDLNSGEYVFANEYVQAQWEAWQASRESYNRKQRRTIEYVLGVLPDGEGSRQRFKIISYQPVDSRLLQIVGLLLAGGSSRRLIREQLPTAQVYVSVNPQHEESWVTDAIFSIGED